MVDIFNIFLNVSIIIIVFFNSSNSTSIKQCKAPAGKTIAQTDAVFGDCVAPPCEAKKGTNITVDMIFTADGNYAEVTQHLFAIVMGIKQGYPGMDGVNGCSTNNFYLMPDKIKTSCPLEKGKQYMYETVLFVKPTFPKIKATMHFSLSDKVTKAEFACFELPAQIV